MPYRPGMNFPQDKEKPKETEEPEGELPRGVVTPSPDTTEPTETEESKKLKGSTLARESLLERTRQRAKEKDKREEDIAEAYHERTEYIKEKQRRERMEGLLRLRGTAEAQRTRTKYGKRVASGTEPMAAITQITAEKEQKKPQKTRSKYGERVATGTPPKAAVTQIIAEKGLGKVSGDRRLYATEGGGLEASESVAIRNIAQRLKEDENLKVSDLPYNQQKLLYDKGVLRDNPKTSNIDESKVRPWKGEDIGEVATAMALRDIGGEYSFGRKFTDEEQELLWGLNTSERRLADKMSEDVESQLRSEQDVKREPFWKFIEEKMPDVPYIEDVVVGYAHGAETVAGGILGGAEAATGKSLIYEPGFKAREYKPGIGEMVGEGLFYYSLSAPVFAGATATVKTVGQPVFKGVTGGASRAGLGGAIEAAEGFVTSHATATQAAMIAPFGAYEGYKTHEMLTNRWSESEIEELGEEQGWSEKQIEKQKEVLEGEKKHDWRDVGLHLAKSGGIMAGAYQGIQAGAKADVPQLKYGTVEVGEKTPAKGLFLEYGGGPRKAKWLVGRAAEGSAPGISPTSETSWFLGTPRFTPETTRGIYGPALRSYGGYLPSAPQDFPVFQQNVPKMYSESPIFREIHKISLDIHSSTYGASAPKEISSLEDIDWRAYGRRFNLADEEIQTIKGALKGQSDLQLYGSRVTQAQMADDLPRTLGDIDVALVRNPEEFAKGIAGEIRGASTEGTTVVKGGHHLLDIKGKPTDYGSTEKWLGYGFRGEPYVSGQNFDFMSLSESATRKGPHSALTARLSGDELVYLPKAHRVFKDISDYIAIESELGADPEALSTLKDLYSSAGVEIAESPATTIPLSSSFVYSSYVPPSEIAAGSLSGLSGLVSSSYTSVSPEPSAPPSDLGLGSSVFESPSTRVEMYPTTPSISPGTKSKFAPSVSTSVSPPTPPSMFKSPSLPKKEETYPSVFSSKPPESETSEIPSSISPSYTRDELPSPTPSASSEIKIPFPDYRDKDKKGKEKKPWWLFGKKKHELKSPLLIALGPGGPPKKNIFQMSEGGNPFGG